MEPLFFFEVLITFPITNSERPADTNDYCNILFRYKRLLFCLLNVALVCQSER